MMVVKYSEKNVIFAEYHKGLIGYQSIITL